ncbi:unnamed protein product [Linum trigynum]|uniref:Uncharacterized protein n=1 Tax=Linum trigynum TaxID=586398 RepID=A0AAV2EIT0_9ROSI
MTNETKQTQMKEPYASKSTKFLFVYRERRIRQEEWKGTYPWSCTVPSPNSEAIEKRNPVEAPTVEGEISSRDAIRLKQQITNVLTARAVINRNWAGRATSPYLGPPEGPELTDILQAAPHISHPFYDSPDFPYQ